jgi:hypothetical protein
MGRMKMGILPRMGGRAVISETKKPGSFAFLEWGNWSYPTLFDIFGTPRFSCTVPSFSIII